MKPLNVLIADGDRDLGRSLAGLRKSLALLAAVFFLFPFPGQAASLTLGGTGAGLATMKLLGEAFQKANPGITVEVLPSLGSGGGIKALLAGAIDVALTARPLKDKERARGVKEFAYAKTAVVLATPMGSAQSNVTNEELVEIFAGTRIAWPDGTPIYLVLRRPHDSETRILKAHVPGIDSALAKAQERPGVPVAYTVQDAADLIQSRPGGLGTASLSMIIAEKRPLKGLSLNGVAPTPETLADGSYPMAKTFYIVTKPEPNNLVREFVAFVRSDEGANILRRMGHLVLRDE